MAKIDREARVRQLAQTDEAFWSQGIVLAGMDEAGRGPWWATWWPPAW